MRHVKWTLGFAAAMVLGLWQPASHAQTSGTATYTVTQPVPGTYEYDVTLTNTGSTPIGSFWFGWIPGYDLLPTIPSSVTAPYAWTGASMEEGIGGSSVLWSAGIPLGTGQSQSGFVFDTTDSPTVMSGTSAFFGLPVRFSYIYSGVAEAPGTTFGTLTPQQVTATPEPGTLLLLPAALMLVRRRRLQ